MDKLTTAPVPDQTTLISHNMQRCVALLVFCLKLAPVAPTDHAEGLVLYVVSPANGRWLYPTRPALRYSMIVS